MEHWKNEYKRLIVFLEEQTGKKMDYDRLKEVVGLSYRLTELHLEIDKLIAHVPSSMSAECFAGTLLAIRLLPGTPAGHRLPRRNCATSSRSAWTMASAPSRTSASG